MDWALIAAALLLVIFYAYSRLRRQLNYWSDRGVFVENPSFPMGNLNGYGKRHFCDNMQMIYDKFARRDVFCGFYFATSARALILDLELLKHVMIKDFQYFADRKSYFNERDDPLSAHLFNQRGAKWRLMRQQLSPTFTSGKMKMMFDLVAGETANLVQATERKLGSDIDCKDLFMRYIADVIGMCAFGLDCQSLRNDDAAIIKMGHKVFELNNFAFLFQSTFEDLALWMKMRLFKKEATDYFYSVIKNTVDNREQNNIKRKDFMNLLIELKNHGKFVDDNESENLGKITFNELAAQAFIFMVAGFETTSTTMQFCLLELAKNQDIQQRVRDEVNEVLRKNNGKWTYESLQELHYLNMCINESMRKWPAVFILMRNTLKDYKVPNTTHILEKDTQIIIPTWCIHRDPKYYPDPERFDPDRFLPENEKTRHPMAFIPFGDGPRNCIGMRFAYLQMKLGLASVISQFKFTLSPQTRLEMDPTNLFITVKTGAWVRAEKL